MDKKIKYVERILLAFLGLTLIFSLFLPIVVGETGIDEIGSIYCDGFRSMFVDGEQIISYTLGTSTFLGFLLGAFSWHQFILGVIILALAVSLFFKENSTIAKVLNVLVWVGLYFCLWYSIMGIVFAILLNGPCDGSVSTYAYISFIIYAFVLMFKVLFGYVEKVFNKYKNKIESK